jgi:type I restriction enzyme S subunit
MAAFANRIVSGAYSACFIPTKRVCVPLSREHRSRRVGNFDYYGASGVIDHIDDFLFERPLLLVGEDGANLVLRNSPIAFMARGKYWVNSHAHVLDSLDERSLVYLGIFINATDLKPFVTGTAQPKLNQARMNNIPCPLPPSAEQHRIVARVDELMGLLDRLEERLAAARAAHVAFAAAAVHHLEA